MQLEPTSKELTAYVKGWREGYILTKHLPDMAKDLAASKNKTPYFEGFRAGKDEYLREQMRERLPKWLRDDFNSTDPYMKTKGKDLDRDLER